MWRKSEMLMLMYVLAMVTLNLILVLITIFAVNEGIKHRKWFWPIFIIVNMGVVVVSVGTLLGSYVDQLQNWLSR
jgi:ABC-type sugar transport system permease subunit